jgi:uncharacterized peroxidase-related enzyme
MSTLQLGGTGYLEIPETTADIQRMYDHDVEQHGFVMNLSRLWAHQPALHAGLFDLIAQAVRAGGLAFRDRAVLVVACAATLGDSYCSLAWGNKLAGAAGADVAEAVLRREDARLDPKERTLARWARRMTRDPASTEARDVQPLRDAGYDDAQILAITVFVALRLAFAVTNDALGAQPDHQLSKTVPSSVRDAVTFGRPAASHG